jgi:hypothetical protein
MELCYGVRFGYAHSRRGLTNGDLPPSNGPTLCRGDFSELALELPTDRLDLLEGPLFLIARQGWCWILQQDVWNGETLDIL